METGGCSQFSSKTRKKSDKSRRIWSLQEEEVLVASLKDIITKGWKSENGFRTGYLAVLEQSMVKAFPGTNLRADPHIHSKIHVWKRIHSCLETMLSRSGFNWNDTAHVITADDDALWDKHIKTDSYARTMRFKSFPFYRAWCEIFGKDRATGEHAEDCNAAADDLLDARKEKDTGETPHVWPPGAYNVLDDENEPMSVCQPKGSGTGTQKKSSSKRKKSIDSVDERMVDMMGQYCTDTNQRLGEITKRIGYEFDASEKRKVVYEALRGISGFTRKQKIYVARILVNNSKDLDLFFSLPDEDNEEMVGILLNGSN